VRTNSNRVPTAESVRKRCSFWRLNMLLQICNTATFLSLHKKAAVGQIIPPSEQNPARFKYRLSTFVTARGLNRPCPTDGSDSGRGFT
jgi:hypothetical protein